MEKELNQTTNDVQEVKEVDFAETRKKIEERYQTKLTKAEAEFKAQLEAANSELNFYKNDLPNIEATFKKLGGNLDYFNDWLTLNKSKLDFKDLDKSVAATFETTKWAKTNANTFNVSQNLNQATGLNSNKVDLGELIPGTIYKKRY